MYLKKIYFISILILLSLTVSSQEIFTAMMRGNEERAKELINADSMNAINKNQRDFSPIHFAANFNSLEFAFDVPCV